MISVAGPEMKNLRSGDDSQTWCAGHDYSPRSLFIGSYQQFAIYRLRQRMKALLEYRSIMAGNTEIADAWEGAAGPKIKPEPINKSWRNDSDPTRRRATFGVPYPVWEIAIEKSADLQTKLPSRYETTKRRSIEGIRFHLLVPNLIFSEADFRKCKFHRSDREGKSKISSSTFKNCRFQRCMFGGTVFRHVAFESCEFRRCDFGASEFSECQFIDCKFTECTAENVSFVATEVDPTAVLHGMPAPTYNYEEPIPDGEQTAAQVTSDWVEVRRKLAAQLLRSNTDIHHSSNCDRGLFELKRAELKGRIETLRAQPLKEGMVRLPFRATQILMAWLVLNATKGGTSLTRLFLVAIFSVLLFAFLLSNSHVMFMNQDCHLASFQPSLVMQQLARATSLFLAIGYTAFSGGPLATILLTAAASLGLLWYALVAEVVIHRVYR
jgi:Pentapeptide repeats (9 copies)